MRVGRRLAPSACQPPVPSPQSRPLSPWGERWAYGGYQGNISDERFASKVAQNSAFPNSTVLPTTKAAEFLRCGTLRYLLALESFSRPHRVAEVLGKDRHGESKGIRFRARTVGRVGPPDYPCRRLQYFGRILDSSGFVRGVGKSFD